MSARSKHSSTDTFTWHGTLLSPGYAPVVSLKPGDWRLGPSLCEIPIVIWPPLSWCERMGLSRQLRISRDESLQSARWIDHMARSFRLHISILTVLFQPW